MKIPLLFLFAVSVCLPALGKETTPVPQVRHVRMWKVQPGLIPHRSASDAQWSAREWLEANGVEFSAGDEALCDSAGNLIVRARNPAMLDSIDALLQFTGRPLPPPMNLRVEVVLAEFPAVKVLELKGKIPYATLRKAAGDSWHVLNHMVTVTPSGQRVTISSKVGAPEKKPATPLPEQGQPQSSGGSETLLPGESGATLTLETVLNENGKTIDVNVDYQAQGTGPPAWHGQAVLPIVVTDGVPVIAQLDTAPSASDPSSAAKLRALVLRVDVVHPKKTKASRSQRPASSPGPTAPAR